MLNGLLMVRILRRRRAQVADVFHVVGLCLQSYKALLDVETNEGNFHRNSGWVTAQLK